jgi:hypothetical protein
MFRFWVETADCLESGDEAFSQFATIVRLVSFGLKGFLGIISMLLKITVTRATDSVSELGKRTNPQEQETSTYSKQEKYTCNKIRKLKRVFLQEFAISK